MYDKHPLRPHEECQCVTMSTTSYIHRHEEDHGCNFLVLEIVVHFLCLNKFVGLHQALQNGVIIQLFMPFGVQCA